MQTVKCQTGNPQPRCGIACFDQFNLILFHQYQNHYQFDGKS
jgi:hypothetical protein